MREEWGGPTPKSFGTGSGTGPVTEHGTGPRLGPVTGPQNRFHPFWTIPLYLMIPVVFALILRHLGHFYWAAFGIGALGWLVALFLRGPVGFAMRNAPKTLASTVLVLSSGVLEEGIRVVLLILTGTSFSWALSLGQGWAAIEVIYTIVYIILLSVLRNRTDEEAQQAKAILESQGLLNQNPVWGLVERVFASLIHIGNSLIIAFNPYLAIVMVPEHSLVNFTLLKVQAKYRSVVKTELFVAICGLAVLLIGLAFFGKL